MTTERRKRRGFLKLLALVGLLALLAATALLALVPAGADTTTNIGARTFTDGTKLFGNTNMDPGIGFAQSFELTAPGTLSGFDLELQYGSGNVSIQHTFRWELRTFPLPGTVLQFGEITRTQADTNGPTPIHIDLDPICGVVSGDRYAVTLKRTIPNPTPDLFFWTFGQATPSLITPPIPGTPDPKPYADGDAFEETGMGTNVWAIDSAQDFRMTVHVATPVGGADSDSDGIPDSIENAVDGLGINVVGIVTSAVQLADGTIVICVEALGFPGQLFTFTLPPGTMTETSSDTITLEAIGDLSQPKAEIKKAALPPGTAKQVTLPFPAPATNNLIILDAPGATLAELTTSGTSIVIPPCPCPASTTLPPWTVTNNGNNTITVSGLEHTALGIFLDSDGDLVPDSVDACPLTPGLVDLLGCPAVFLVIDDETIDNGISTIQAISSGGAPFCGGPAGGPGNSGVCVNDDIASDGTGRDPLCDPNNPMVLFSRPGPPPSISGLRLPTGQFGDEGLFSLISPSATFLDDYLDGCDLDLLPADPVSGFQGQLDPVAGFPLGNLQIEALEGRTVCAVVHDSNVNVEDNQLDLEGNRLGLTAFDVTDVLPPPAGLPEAGSSSSLPVIEVDIINDPDQVLAICEGPLEFLPEPPPDRDSDGDGFDDNVEVAAGTNPVRACADSPVLPPLIDPNPADVDNDTFFDITDIAAFAARFGQTGPPRYDVAPGSPAGPDGFVDITDITAVAALFGQSCASP